MSINMDKAEQSTDLRAATQVVPRVNLMPQEILAENKFRRTQVVLGGALLLVLAGLAGGWALSVLDVQHAEDGLAAEQVTAQQLATEEAKYAEVPKLLSNIDSVQNAQAQAMVQDVAWYAQLDKINQEFPAGLRFASLNMTMFTATAGAAATANPLATPNQIGTITVEGIGPDYVNVSQWLDAMAAHPGFVDPYYSSATLGYNDSKKTTEVSTTTTVGFTDEVLSHRFDRKAQ